MKSKCVFVRENAKDTERVPAAQKLGGYQGVIFDVPSVFFHSWDFVHLQISTSINYPLCPVFHAVVCIWCHLPLSHRRRVVSEVQTTNPMVCDGGGAGGAESECVREREGGGGIRGSDSIFCQNCSKKTEKRHSSPTETNLLFSLTLSRFKCIQMHIFQTYSF